MLICSRKSRESSLPLITIYVYWYILSHAETCQNFSCWTCTLIVTFLFIAGLAIGFFILLARPNPTVTTHQGVAPGDTVPLYYASKTEIPEGGSKIWYESLTVNIDSAEKLPPETVVTVSFVRANYAKNTQACSPPAGNIDTKIESGQFELNSTHNTHSVSTKPFFFTSGATFSLNFTVTSPGDSMLSVYIVDDFGAYECLLKGSEDSCSPDNRKDFNVSSGVQESLNETFSISSYYFIVLASEDAQSLVGNYEYEATSQFYNYTDYSDRVVSTCDVTQDKECTLGISNFEECALVYTSTAISGVDFIPLKVVAHHRRFNIISIVFLALFVASLTLVTTGFLSVLILTCLKRRSIYVRSGYSKL